MPVNVFVFGAGASLHVDGPPSGEILSRAVGNYTWDNQDDHYYNNFEAVLRAFDKTMKTSFLPRIRPFRQKHHRPSFDDFESQELEQLVTTIEEVGDPELSKSLYDVLYTTIEESIRQSDVYCRRDLFGHRSHWRNHYDQLVDYLLPIEDESALISFNYDLALDTAAAINDRGCLGDYGLPFSQIEKFDRYKRLLDGDRRPDDVDLLKLHGSFNWGYCTTCGQYFLFFASNFRGIISERCKECGTPLSPVLIPPTFQKSSHLDVVKPVWDRASAVLRRATTLCVIGYSFRDADREACCLFQNSLGANSTLHTLAICDPDSERISSKVQGYIGREVEVIQYGRFEDMCRSLIGPWTARW